MSTLLRILFLYIPAALGYYGIISAMLIYFGLVENPYTQSFNSDEYTPVYSETLSTGTQVTIHERK